LQASEIAIAVQNFGSEMVNGGTGTLTMRLVRSKLRKSTNIVVDDHHENEDDHHPPTVNFGDTETTMTNNCSTVIKEHPHVTFVRTSGVSSQPSGHADVTAITEWTFPPKAPVPHIYHINPVRKNNING